MPGYRFLLTMLDGKAAGGGVDKFRIEITGPGGVLVYDNVPGAPDKLSVANPQAIGGGNATIH